MSNLLVETQSGKVRGTTNAGISIWRGIPYAEPPTGARRFCAPHQAKPWTDVRDAVTFGPIAPQDLSQQFSGGGTTEAPVAADEDCLYLNIWSPAADDKKRPVMVWIHGGAFILGSGSTPEYDGTTFAAHGDIVVVTLNYRLGALGFLYLGDLAEEYATSGNNGLLDQVAALQWVHDNIAAFGGDPENVTVFGESAGAMSIGLLLAMPAARGLFQRAILESGAASTIASTHTATAIRQEFFHELQLADGDVHALATTSVDAIIAAQKALGARRGLITCQPVLDGTVFPLHPLDAIARGSASDIAILIGTNLDEMKLFTNMGLNATIPDEQGMQKILGPNGAAMLAEYTTRLHLPQQEAWVAAQTDQTFRRPSIQLAERQLQQNADVWMYRFDWATPAFGGVLGSCHALEIPFVWSHLDDSQLAMFLGNTITPAMQELAAKMHAAWIAFARTGNPDTNQAGLPAWPRYNTTKRSTLIFNEECRVLDDPQAVERQIWEQFL